MTAAPVGDQSVFSDIDVRLHVSGYDAVDPGEQLSGALVVNEARIVVALEDAVEINGGTPVGRMAGLHLFSDGFQIETSSAGATPKLSFQFRPDNPIHGQSAELEFRIGTASFFLDVAPLVVTLTNPSAGQIVSANQLLVLQWSGIAASPSRATVTDRGDGCVVFFKQTDPTTFVPQRAAGQGRHEPPCLFQTFAEWLVEEAPPPSPFRSLRVQRLTGRIQRFIVQ